MKIKPFPWMCGECGQRAVHPAKTTYMGFEDVDVFQCQNCKELILSVTASEKISDYAKNRLDLDRKNGIMN